VSDHLRATELIPWLVNKRLEGEALTWLTTHLDGCDRCRAVLESERKIYAAVNASDTIEYAPQASFNRLWSRIESGHVSDLAHARAAQTVALEAPLGRRSWARLAVSLLLATGAGALLWQWRGAVAPAIAPAQYRTVTSSATLAPAGSINVIFSDGATMADVQLILQAAGLSVISGPSSAGVFNVGFNARQRDADLTASLKSLRNDPRVRFAEPSASTH
jgi:hypothetical protein